MKKILKKISLMLIVLCSLFTMIVTSNNSVFALEDSEVIQERIELDSIQREENKITFKTKEKIIIENITYEISYLNNLTDFRDFVTRSPEEYARWIFATSKEAAEFEIAELLSISKDKKVIVDTNIPIDILKEISDYNHVAVMVSPLSMSVERFFDRNDPEKLFILNTIESCENSAEVMENYKKGLALINSQENYDLYANSGFFTVVREDNQKDTKEEVCEKIAKHFGLV